MNNISLKTYEFIEYLNTISEARNALINAKSSKELFFLELININIAQKGLFSFAKEHGLDLELLNKMITSFSEILPERIKVIVEACDKYEKIKRLKILKKLSKLLSY